MKTGYICDINSYILTLHNQKQENIIIKINNYENELSKVAVKLNMYKNERYFYDNIAELIKNKVPKCFGTFEYNQKDVIILQNLNNFTGQFNIDLNYNIDILFNVISTISEIHNKYYFRSNKEIINSMLKLKTVKQITYYSELIHNRFDKFMLNNKSILSDQDKKILTYIYNNFSDIIESNSSYPLSFCHGDFKSPNIFYKNNKTPILLDWQYIHLNKGVSDIVFLLVESIDFDFKLCEKINGYYFSLVKSNYNNFEEYMIDFKNSLCIFPFFVCVWFNSEDNDKLIDKNFPLTFMKNYLLYLNYFITQI